MADLAHQEYYSGLARYGLSAAWARPEAPHDTPRSRFKPSYWRFAQAKAALDEAGRFMTTAQAERRNLTCLSPIPDHGYGTTHNLVANYQMIKPGETARMHRHTPAALRLVVDVKPGVYTVVDGKRVDMANGDVVLTPAWCWHGHANESDEPAYWIDFLDAPFVRQSETAFFEPHPEPFRSLSSGDPDSPFRIAPERILAGRKSGVVEIAKDIMPTIGLYLIAGSVGERIEFPLSTAASIYSVISGQARLVIDGELDAVMEAGDVGAAPCWRAHRLEAQTATVLLRVTDEPLLARLGLLKSS